MKKLLLLLFLTTVFISQVMAQGSLTVATSHTNAAVCTAPCNGTATVTNVTGGTPPYTYLWGTNPTQSTPTATGLCPGSYSVGVGDATSPIPNFGGATVIVTCIQGVNEYVLNQFVEIFPNPASDNISVTLSYSNGGMIKEISVFNSLGEKVLHETFSSFTKFNNAVDLRALSSGTYFLELRDQKNTYRTKFVKQ